MIHSGRTGKCTRFLGLIIGGITAIAAIPSAAQDFGGVDLSNMRGVWTKVCSASNAGPTCFTSADFGRNGSIRLALAVYNTPGELKLLRAMVPVGALETQKIRVSENGRTIAALKHTVCNTQACFAEAKITNAEVDKFTDISKLKLTIEDNPNKRVTFNLSMKGFLAGFKGNGITKKQARQLVEPL